MPKIPAERLEEIGRALFIAAGTPEQEAALVMRHIVGANLVGHDSHGVIQIPTYIERIKVGHIVPGAPWVIVKESPTTTVVDGHWGFGYVVNERAMRLTIEKAEKGNVAAATVFRQGHIGRLSSYTQMAARAGMIGLITADSGRSPKAVAPFGGREARLGTNPISMAIPSDLDGPLYLDMATSAAAAARSRWPSRATSRCRMAGSSAATASRPTIRANCARAAHCCHWAPGGRLQGHRPRRDGGNLCGLLTGLGFGVEPTGRHNDGCFMAVFKVDAFRRSPSSRRRLASSSISEGDAALRRQQRRALSRRDRAPARAGPPQGRHRCRGFDLGQDQIPGRRLRPRRSSRSSAAGP